MTSKERQREGKKREKYAYLYSINLSSAHECAVSSSPVEYEETEDHKTVYIYTVYVCTTHAGTREGRILSLSHSLRAIPPRAYVSPVWKISRRDETSNFHRVSFVFFSYLPSLLSRCVYMRVIILSESGPDIALERQDE